MALFTCKYVKLKKIITRFPVNLQFSNFLGKFFYKMLLVYIVKYFTLYFVFFFFYTWVVFPALFEHATYILSKILKLTLPVSLHFGLV